MKKWTIQIRGTTTIEVIADSYEDAMASAIANVGNGHDVDWRDLSINKNAIEVTDEKD